NDVNVAIRDIQDSLGAMRRNPNMKRAKRFIEGMSQLRNVIEVFLNVSKVVAFIWVGIGYVPHDNCNYSLLARDPSSSFCSRPAPSLTPSRPCLIHTRRLATFCLTSRSSSGFVQNTRPSSEYWSAMCTRFSSSTHRLLDSL